MVFFDMSCEQFWLKDKNNILRFFRKVLVLSICFKALVSSVHPELKEGRKCFI